MYAPAEVPLPVRLRRTATMAALFAVLGGLLYLKAIPCTFATVFHAPCPGCGSTRAVLALLHGDLHGVVRYNPLGPVLALLLGIIAAQALRSIAKHGDARDVLTGWIGRLAKYAIFVVVALEVALWGARFFGAFGGPVPV